jgi:hypothetical protein
VAVQHGIWKIGCKPQALSPVQLDSENLLEEQIFHDLSILNGDWLLLGRQVFTDYGKYIDLLAMDVSGDLIVIELKKHRTPRDVVAQTIDYASWVESLSSERLAELYIEQAKLHQWSATSLDEAFKQKFGKRLSEDELNRSHQMVVVAAELDQSTERIINYLNKVDVPINAVFFSAFRDGENLYLSRSWMIDPKETEENAANRGETGSWNGEYYGSYGVIEGGRSWADARKYGFISAGGGRWYSKTLFNLKPGDRVWVNIPKTGYVGVAEVTAEARQACDFIRDDMQLQGRYQHGDGTNEDEAEYMVPVKWLHAVDESAAVNEVGLFGNQNTIAQPKTPKWEHTVKRLKKLWALT